jgi:hypothetical protein
MWARVVEFMLAMWLGLSPFILKYPPGDTFLWANAWICCFLIALFALLSFYERLEKIHLLTCLVALWLIGVAYRQFPQSANLAEQNSMALGVLFFLFALVPSRSEKSPKGWREFMHKKK